MVISNRIDSSKLDRFTDQIKAFYGDHITSGQSLQATIIAYLLIAAVLALLIWTILDMHKGNERLKNVLAKENVTSTYEHLAKMSASATSEEEFDEEATAERNSEQR